MIKIHEDGFSLLEVSVAVTIMAILTGLGLTIASNVNEGNGAKSQAYETSAQTNIDYAACAAERIADSSISCTSVDDLNSRGGGSNGVTAIWNGAELTYSINANICNQFTPDASYYYNSAFGGSGLMRSISGGGSFYPSVEGYGLGEPLGYGNTISSYYVVIGCNGITTRSDNNVS